MKCSIDRVKWYIRILIAMNFRDYAFKYFSVAIGMIGTILIISVLSQVNIIGAPSGNFVKILLDLLLIIYAVMSFSFVSSVFVQFHRKESSIQAFTLPASSLEKYVATVIFVFAATFLLMFMGYIIASLFMYFLTKGWLWHRLLFTELYNIIPFHIVKFFILFSFFLFGGVLFRTSQFFKTIVLFFVLSFLFNILLFAYAFTYNGMHNKVYIFMHTSFLGSNMQGILLVLSVLLIVLGYFRFRQLQYK